MRENGESIAPSRAQKRARGKSGDSTGSPQDLGQSADPLAAQFRQLIADKDSPNFGEFRYNGQFPRVDLIFANITALGKFGIPQEPILLVVVGGVGGGVSRDWSFFRGKSRARKTPAVKYIRLRSVTRNYILLAIIFF